MAIVRTVRRLKLLAALFLLFSAGSAAAQNLYFTVAPGGTINIQNLSGTTWYFYNNPSPATATMYRVSENLSQSHVWGSAQFRSDLSGAVSKVNPREFLRFTAGPTPTGSVIQVARYDGAFDNPYSINITVQSGTAQVQSINRLDASPNGASSVRWEITFNRAVAGVRAANLALIFPNNGQPSPQIGDIVPSPNGNYLRWIVTANTNGREIGTLALKWNATSIESPSVPTAFTGQSYDLQAPPPTTFTVRQFSFINIKNVTDDAWYFSAPPATSTTTMARVSEDGTIEEWGSANFGPDINNTRNRILRNQSLRIGSGSTPVDTTIVANYLTPQSVAKSISIKVNQAFASVVSITRLDPTSTTSSSLRWEVTFDRPVAGVVPWNFEFLNYTGMGANITAIDPDVLSGFRKWRVTATTSGSGNGPLTLRWQNWNTYTPESPRATNGLTGETYELNPLSFNVPPNGTIDIENFYAERLHFRAAPTPATAQMYKVSPNFLSEDVWGGPFFNYNNNSTTNNYVSRSHYLRVTSGSTPVGTSIVMRGYRTTFSTDTGFEIRVKVEVPDAQVTSINIIDPSPTVANSVRWDVTFNKPMANVTPANFGFINTARIDPTPTVTNVTVVPNSNNTKWRVTADTTGTGTGLLGLRYLGHAIETPVAPNTFNGQFYDFSSYPLITTDPTPLSAILVTGSQAPTLHVTATIRTEETLIYNWRKRLGSTPHFEDPVVGTTPSFTPPTNVPGHHTYYCRVFTMGQNGSPSGFYAHSLPSTMHVYDPPEIVAQPPDVGVAPGGTGSIFVDTVGTELQYRWYKGQAGDRSQPLANTNAATFVTPALTQNERYWVLVFNALGAEYEVESRTVTARVVAQVLLAQEKFTPVVDSDVEGMKARALDSEGVPASNANITFASSISGVIGGLVPAGNFDGRKAIGGSASAIAVTDAEGWATAPKMWTNTKSGSYEVVAKSQGPTTAIAAPITIDNQPGAPVALAWITQPSANATAGVPFAAQPKLTLHDAWANPVTRAHTFVAQADKSLGLLQGTTSIETSNGEVTFTDLAHHTAERIQLRITCGAVFAISNDINVVPGPAALITAVAGSPQGARPGEQFARKLTAKISDAYGNGIAGQSVKFQSPMVKATASFPQGDTIVTDAHGQAAVTARATSFSGAYNVTATATQHATLSGAVFQLWNLSNLEAWRAENFSGDWLSNGNAANGATPFNDGVPNLLKYAFNLNATAADHTLMTNDGVRGLPLVGLDDQGRLTVTFVRRKGVTFPGINYSVVFADDLGGAFAENPAATTSTPVAIDGTWERVTVTDSVSAADSAAQRFARVQVSEQ